MRLSDKSAKTLSNTLFLTATLQWVAVKFLTMSLMVLFFGVSKNTVLLRLTPILGPPS